MAGLTNHSNQSLVPIPDGLNALKCAMYIDPSRDANVFPLNNWLSSFGQGIIGRVFFVQKIRLKS